MHVIISAWDNLSFWIRRILEEEEEDYAMLHCFPHHIVCVSMPNTVLQLYV